MGFVILRGEEARLKAEAAELDAIVQPAIAKGPPYSDAVIQAAQRRGDVQNVLRDMELRKLETEKAKVRSKAREEDRAGGAAEQQDLAAIEHRQTELRLETERDPERRKELEAKRDALAKKVEFLDEARNVERSARRVAEAKIRLRKAIYATPWHSANKGIRPNQCTTCADSPQRFDPVVEDKSSRSLTPEQARDEVKKTFPGLTDPKKPMKVDRLNDADLSKACGKSGVACAQPFTGRIFLPAGKGGEGSALVMHETLHAMSSPKWLAAVPPPVNESMTEYLTRKMGYFRTGEQVLEKGYEGGQPLIDAWVKGGAGREAALTKAYFTGDMSDVKKLDPSFDKTLADWGKKLTNVKPGSSLNRDDESLPPEPEPFTIPWGF